MESASDKTVEAGLEQGFVRIEGQNAGFMDPVRVLSANYELHEIKSERYYSRAFFTSLSPVEVTAEGSGIRKRKRKRKVYTPNVKEAIAESRHQEVRSVILEAHEAFQATVAPFLRRYITFSDDDTFPTKSCSSKQKSVVEEGELNFVEVATLWQAPLYEISSSKSINGQVGCKDEEFMSSALFNTVFENLSTTSVVAQCGGCKYLLPRLSKFLISDIAELHQLIPGDKTIPSDLMFFRIQQLRVCSWVLSGPSRNSQGVLMIDAVGVSDEGFNLIVIDPPWENKSVHRKALYPTIPNRYLLSLPVRQLAHADGALVALWITNREKLRHFVETELFPAWGVSLAAVWYWLKVTAEGTMVSSLDLAHHKPYECLLLGYLPSIDAPVSREESVDSTDSREKVLLPDKYVLMSIPGDHSRKPPLKSILSNYVPGRREADKGLELFARELNAGWTSWGNEPLRFQHVNYFRERQSFLVTASSKC